MLTRLTILAVSAAAILLPLGQIVAEAPQQTPSYDSFLEDHEESADDNSATTPPTTWGVSPGKDGAIGPEDPDESYELLVDAPLLDLDSLGPQLPDVRVLPEPDDPLTLAALLASNDGAPPDEPSSRRQLVRIILIGLAVVIVGALAGVGVELWRARHGKRPDPARNPRVFR